MCCNWKYIVFWCRVFAVFFTIFFKVCRVFSTFLPWFSTVPTYGTHDNNNTCYAAQPWITGIGTRNAGEGAGEQVFVFSSVSIRPRVIKKISKYNSAEKKTILGFHKKTYFVLSNCIKCFISKLTLGSPPQTQLGSLQRSSKPIPVSVPVTTTIV